METQKKNCRKSKKKCTVKHALYWLGETQFHGANRLAEREDCWFWIPSITLLLISCIMLVHFIVYRYQQNPTYMMQLDAGNYKMTFPAVIICPEVNFRTYKMKDFLAKIKYPASLNQSYVKKILPQLAVFFNPDVLSKFNDLVNLEHLLKYNQIDIETAGKRLTSSCEEILIRCRWQNIYQNCSKIFRMELTRDGFCCVFNGRSLRREMRQSKPIKQFTTKLDTNTFGFTSGLMIAINQSQTPWNIDLSYKWIGLKGGSTFVDTSFNGTPLNPGSEQWLYYYVYGFHIADMAKVLTTDLRRCKLEDEPMTYFPTYRKRYCILECEIANTIKWCNCVRIVHPRPRGVSYCDAKGLQCAYQVSNSDCNCLQTCNSDSALIRSSSFLLNTSGIHSTDRFYANLDYKKVTVVRTFIQKRRTTVKERWSYFTYMDLFSQLGGIFNMFFGCSVLTILGLLRAVWSILLKACTVNRQTVHRRE